MLARSFPTLANAPGVSPWNVDLFLPRASGPVMTSGTLHAVRFVLSVWNPYEDWREVARIRNLDGAEALTRFDALGALAAWDHAHRLAFIVWAESPFWP